jgi:subtilase family serine protease
MATPLFAGVVALADQMAGHALGPINPAIYKMAASRDPGIVDVTAGSNSIAVSHGGATHVVRGFRAVPGYDLVSGVGTVNAAFFVPELARLAG